MFPNALHQYCTGERQGGGGREDSTVLSYGNHGNMFVHVVIGRTIEHSSTRRQLNNLLSSARRIMLNTEAHSHVLSELAKCMNMLNMKISKI